MVRMVNSTVQHSAEQLCVYLFVSKNVMRSQHRIVVLKYALTHVVVFFVVVVEFDNDKIFSFSVIYHSHQFPLS